MECGEVHVVFKVKGVDGKKAIEITNPILERLYKSGLHRLVDISWNYTKIFDEEGNLVRWAGH